MSNKTELCATVHLFLPPQPLWWLSPANRCRESVWSWRVSAKVSQQQHQEPVFILILFLKCDMGDSASSFKLGETLKGDSSRHRVLVFQSAVVISLMAAVRAERSGFNRWQLDYSFAKTHPSPPQKVGHFIYSTRLQWQFFGYFDEPKHRGKNSKVTRIEPQGCFALSLL